MSLLAHLCWPCSKDMHSQISIVLMKNVEAGDGIQTKIA